MAREPLRPMGPLYVTRRGLLRGGAGAAGAVALGSLPLHRLGPAGALAQEPRQGGEIIYALSSDPPNLDPHVGSGTAAQNVKVQIYSTLATYAHDGTLQPDLAESWQVSEDGLQYTFTLRAGVTFHDGTPLTAADVEASFQRILDPATGATRQLELSLISEMEVVDDRTITLTLSAPNAAMLQYLAQPGISIMSKKFLDEGGDPNTDMVGTGPFVFVSREPGVSTIVERNGSYYREGQPYLDRITFVPYQDENTRMAAVQGGEVDIAEYVPWKDMAAIEGNPDLQLAAGDESAFMCIMYNVREEPFSNPKVRAALSHAFDRQAISDAVFFGRGAPITGGIIPTASWAYNADLEGTQAFDPDRARQMLADAGYGDGFQATLLSTSQYGMHQSTGEIAQQNLNEIGIQCELELYDWATVVQRQTEGNYQFRVHGLSPDILDPDFLTVFFGSGSSYSKSTGFSDEEIDRLLAEGRATLDQEARKAIYRQVEDRVLELAPWNFLSWRVQAEALQQRVQGYTHLPGALGFLSSITLQETWVEE
ncbi:MAG: ABC transporter substrate-binding protein [Thermomicrobiales bacterium]